MTDKPFCITTPIYYVNGKPHLGHAYSTIVADVFTRTAKLRGRRTHFLTGTDEHGQKIERKAKEEGLSPQEYVDRLIPSFKAPWSHLACEYDDFIRTTEPRHQEVVQALWNRCLANGDIYLGEYEGWYSVADETFYTEKELVDGKAPTGRPVERVREPSYFFKLSAYTDKLLKLYEEQPDFVEPAGRFNEIKSFVREGLRDLSLSRATFRWGVPVPNAPEHVMYVWFDALTNYVSALGGPEGSLYREFWEPHGEVVHLIGKEILRFHAVYWPAFLMSAGLPLPTRIWAHGWLTVNGAKMSKSDNNFLPPEPIADAVSVDAFRYYLLREVALGQDGDFSHQNLIARYHGDLGNGLGNLLNRVVSSIVKKEFDSKVPHVAALTDLDRTLTEVAKKSAEKAALAMHDFAPHRALDAIWELVAAANKYVDQAEPWALAKRGDIERLGTVCYCVMEACRWLSLMLWPVMPNKCDEMRAQIGLPPVSPSIGRDFWPSAWGGLVAGTNVRPGAPLFPRFDDVQQRAIYERLGAPLPANLQTASEVKAIKAKPAKAAAEPATHNGPKLMTIEANEGIIDISELGKVDLRLGLVKEASRVEGSDKLLELKVEVGEETPRTILAGIAEHYAPDALVNRRIAVVLNLPPRTFSKFGKTSHGMVIAASDANGLSVLSPDKEIAAGVKLK